MSNYTKDRNIITISIDGVNGVYRLDINTGEYFGLKGKPIVTISHRREIARLFPYRANGTNLSEMLRVMFDRCPKASGFCDFVVALRCADRIDALGVTNLDLNFDQYAYIDENFKSFTKYITTLKEENRAFRFRDFQAHLEYEKAKKTYGALFDQLTPDMYRAIKDYVPDYTDEEMGVAVYYCTKGKLYDYHGGSLSKLRDYFRWCRRIEKKPEKVNNFMREYTETHNLYELRKTEFDNRAIQENYARQADAWNFEYGDFTIQIPSCGQDLVTEGELMHHCVGGYVQHIIEGACYICFVRNKNDITKPYITCEVLPKGIIRQYYLAYDNHISSEADKAFYQAFQEHLNKVWKK